jgi:ArsR family transcriptional regulator
MENEATIFKVLADPTRLRLMVLLSIQGETCVCRLAEALNAPDFKISRHLGIMRSAGLVEARECLAAHPTVKADLQRLLEASCK